MNGHTVEEIISSIEEKSLLELKNLSDLFVEKFAVTTTSAPESLQKKDDSWTPYYSVKLIRLNCAPGGKLPLIKLIRELLCCGLKEAKEIVENTDQLPRTIWTKFDEHPSECRKQIQPIREKLEALGAVLDEDYDYGYYD